MKRVYIYKITNPAGQVYIGKTINYRKRKWKHKNDFDSCIRNNRKLTLLQESFLKYGFDNHTIELIEENISNKEFGNYLERFYIKEYLSCAIWGKDGLNITDGGDVNYSYKQPKERVQKITRSIQQRENHSIFMKKFNSTPERRKKQSELMKKQWENAQFKNAGDIAKSKAKKYKNVEDGKYYLVSEISKIEGKVKSGIEYHFAIHGHYKNKYIP